MQHAQTNPFVDVAPLGPIPVLETRLPVADRLTYALAVSVGLLIAAGVLL